MKNSTNPNPYEFAVIADGGGWYQYVIRLAKTRENLAGGLCRIRKRAEQEARQRIANLPRGQGS